jgi:alpha-beta hydrolase superfamily lysophospholipase
MGDQMADTRTGVEVMDHPEILRKILFPRRESAADTPASFTHFVRVAEAVALGCRFYRACKDGPNILFFHGNGETAPEYDTIAVHYRVRGLNLFVAEYRGYGMSEGTPTCSNLIADAHTVFKSFASLIHDSGLTGPQFVMGRSLGSAPAIEVAYHYQEHLKGLIVESGFASVGKQLARLGLDYLYRDADDPVGFGNDIKIQAVHIPTLIIHGEKDKVIPVEEGRVLYALASAQDKTSLFVPNAGHNSLMDRALNLYMETIVKFTRRPGD